MIGFHRHRALEMDLCEARLIEIYIIEGKANMPHGIFWVIS